MAEFPHDPEFPFLVVALGGNQVGKFRSKFLAEEYRRVSKTEKMWDIIDTTPKPRIPVDAQYLMWSRHLGRFFAYRALTDRWVHRSEVLTEEELLRDYIGDAEITVLDSRKEES